MSKTSSPSANSTEKRVLLAAILFTALSLCLISYATFGLGITVPTCLPNGAVLDRGAIVKHPGKNYEVHFLAKMWAFEPSRVRIPTGSTLEIFTTSKDVTHGLQINGTNVNLMVEPGVITTARIHFSKSGIFPIVCHEFCGAAHQNMNALIEVSDTAEDISAEGLPDQSGGHAVADERGCLACHSTDGTSGVGPTFKGLWGSKVTMADGTTRVVDDDFVRSMILHPSATPVKGFEPVMPEFQLNDLEIEELVQYLKELR
jgi:cytochrome c oxidase subunit II